MQEKLNMFFSTPGLMKYEDLIEVEYFLTNLKNNLKMYRIAYGTDPLGYTLDSNLKSVEYYKNFKKC